MATTIQATSLLRVGKILGSGIVLAKVSLAARNTPVGSQLFVQGPLTGVRDKPVTKILTDPTQGWLKSATESKAKFTRPEGWENRALPSAMVKPAKFSIITGQIPGNLNLSEVAPSQEHIPLSFAAKEAEVFMLDPPAKGTQSSYKSLKLFTSNEKSEHNAWKSDIPQSVLKLDPAVIGIWDTTGVKKLTLAQAKSTNDRESYDSKYHQAGKTIVGSGVIIGTGYGPKIPRSTIFELGDILTRYTVSRMVGATIFTGVEFDTGVMPDKLGNNREVFSIELVTGNLIQPNFIKFNCEPPKKLNITSQAVLFEFLTDPVTQLYQVWY
ncbi:hypothetical protein [Ewingella americana]|nr:hypothetical protein [Ewingella americana]